MEEVGYRSPYHFRGFIPPYRFCNGTYIRYTSFFIGDIEDVLHVLHKIAILFLTFPQELFRFSVFDKFSVKFMRSFVNPLSQCAVPQ